MTDSFSSAGQSERLEELRKMVAQRADLEARLPVDFADDRKSLDTQHRQDQENLATRYQQDKEAKQTEYQDKVQAVKDECESKQDELLQEYDRVRAEVREQHQHQRGEAKELYRDAKRRSVRNYEEGKAQPITAHVAYKQTVESNLAKLEQVKVQAAAILKKRHCKVDIASENEVDDEIADETAPATGVTREAANEIYQESMQEAGEALRTLASRLSGRFFQDRWPVLLFIASAIGSVPICGFGLGWQAPTWMIAALGFTLGVTGLICGLMWPISRRGNMSDWHEIEGAVDRASAALRDALSSDKQSAEGEFNTLRDATQQQQYSLKAEWEQTAGEFSEKIAGQLAEIDQKYPPQIDAIGKECESRVQELDDEYLPALKLLKATFADTKERLQTRLADDLVAREQKFNDDNADLIKRWHEVVDRFGQENGQLTDRCRELFPCPEEIDWENWQPPASTPPILPFGHYQVDVSQLEGGLSDRRELIIDPSTFELPAVLSYPDCPSMLFRASGEGREVAVQSIQSVMLRLLTSFPPGKVRFTIIDPAGLGQNFAAFMHLADYDERLVSNRIWTESVHINKRLADLTEHMENVIQKYLRNEFSSIQEYNAHAGEVAEPFRILVIANFPVNFSEEAARRLTSITASGARCGVYTLISTDEKIALPRNFDLADLEANAASVNWNSDKFEWHAPSRKSFPLTLDLPPSDEQVTAAICAAGEGARDSNRVEVPFSQVMPEDGQWWQEDSRSEIEAPLGRAGATKLQAMKLGKGTSQHVLIAGKTGSGKSTLMHALIINLALHYSPEEVQFYLIDFKKGVEFKPYATLGLPHARVIAIESEREFGMSVLEKLDRELKDRGDLFRSEGVQDVKGYRDANPQAVMPRLMLIIDEFQELFVQDDKIAHEASLLLDRLVRQGRAFGIHVLLGSQTLAGAYTLARSTMGQMAVRVALQCSETDAHLILSEDNTAARLLNRPGEAIYNDANGMFEGNHPFQVVWLSDSEREHHLDQLSRMAAKQMEHIPAPIVFEGNVPADPGKNPLLVETLESQPTKCNMAPQAWLGAAVAIKDPTAAVFRRHSGSNLLIVGQREEMAVGTMSSCLVSLVAQQPPSNGKPGYWSHFAQKITPGAKIVSPRDASSAIGEVAAELDRRSESGDELATPLYVFIYNLARFRDLQRSDDFGFSMDSDASESSDKQLARILREGPGFGIHAVIWCDTYNNTSRWLERQTLHDVSMRVLFPMSSSDSANLMDSPAAGNLGVHRAYFYSEEEGDREKFRPYGPPDDEWISRVAETLAKP